VKRTVSELAEIENGGEAKTGWKAAAKKPQLKTAIPAMPC